MDTGFNYIEHKKKNFPLTVKDKSIPYGINENLIRTPSGQEFKIIVRYSADGGYKLIRGETKNIQEQINLYKSMITRYIHNKGDTNGYDKEVRKTVKNIALYLKVNDTWKRKFMYEFYDRH